jgi:hypothetical protein
MKNTTITVLVRYNGHDPMLEQEIQAVVGRPATSIHASYPALPDKKTLRRVGCLEFECADSNEADAVSAVLGPLPGVEIVRK